MKLSNVSLNSLVENPNNARVHGDVQIAELKKSIERFGVVRPIVIDENNMILCGHGLYKALQEMGKDTADVVVKKGLSETEKNKLLLADNKIYSLGKDNYRIIEKLMTEMEDFEIPGFDAEILEELYGVKSVENEDVEIITHIDEKEALEEISPEPSKNVTAQRQQAIVEHKEEKYVICPNCGEKVYV